MRLSSRRCFVALSLYCVQSFIQLISFFISRVVMWRVAFVVCGVFVSNVAFGVFTSTVIFCVWAVSVLLHLFCLLLFLLFGRLFVWLFSPCVPIALFPLAFPC